MKKKMFYGFVLFLMLFLIWTYSVMRVDVKTVGVNGSNIGLSGLNIWFHNLTGVNMFLYCYTDLLSIIPLAVCGLFGFIGFYQLVNRKSILKVDHDILVLGCYYVIVIGVFLMFEQIPINYRPILIEGKMDVSYPSSTTLLVLCVMPTLIEQINRRLKNRSMIKIISFITLIYSLLMVFFRLMSGVHWFSDIIGGILLSISLILVYLYCIAIIK